MYIGGSVSSLDTTDVRDWPTPETAVRDVIQLFTSPPTEFQLYSRRLKLRGFDLLQIVVQ